MKTHIDVSLNKSSSSCFFNLIATYTDKPINENELNAQLNSGSMQTLMQLLPTNLYIYQCVNCRLFFTQSSTFSHNCSIVAIENTNHSNSNTDLKYQQSMNNNYFSPIYLKFNITKLLSS
jgi:hypothetical protein